MPSKNYHQSQFSKNGDILFYQYIVSENLFQIYRKCVTHLDLSLRRTHNLSGQMNMNNISSW